MSNRQRQENDESHLNHAHNDLHGNPAGRGTQRRSFPPCVTTEDIAGEVPLSILIKLANHAELPGDCEAVDALGRRILRIIDREIDIGVANSRQAQLATFRVAHAAAVALINEYPSFSDHFAVHGTPPKLKP
jgi:hypothetical protein